MAHIKIKNLTFLHMKGARSRFTRAITQPINTFDVDLATEVTNSFFVTENTSAKPGLDSSKSYLLACIGIITLIFTLLSITHLYISFNEKRKKRLKQHIEMRVSCEKVNMRPPLYYVYSDIAECSGLQMPDCENHQQELEKTELPLKSSSLICTHDKEGKKNPSFQSKKN